MQCLKGVCLIEKDVNGDLITWGFPTISPATDKVLKGRCGLQKKYNAGASYRFSRFGGVWQYISITAVGMKETEEQEQQSKVTAVAISVLSQEFNPAKYKTLLAMFSGLYLDSMSPIPIMKAYLNVFTRGTVKNSFGEFSDSAYDNRKALVSNVKKVFEMYGLEAVVIWVAVLLKKRIFVYHDKVSELLSVIRSFPCLGAWHRQNWKLLRPYMCVTDEEMADLKELGVYIAGFTDPACQARIKDYDLYIDLSARSFSVPDHAQGDFMLTKFHKQAGEGFLKACAGNDQAVIKAIAVKTNELISNIKSLRTEHEDGNYITLKELQQRKLPPNMGKFLFNVAQAEGLTTPGK